jgi:hypothetical protein
VSWLDAQESLPVQEAASALRATIESVEVSGDRARVRTRAVGRSGPPFVQEFELVRDPASGAWQIDVIEQRGLDQANLFSAFAACPSQATIERIYALDVPRSLSPGPARRR